MKSVRERFVHSLGLYCIAALRQICSYRDQATAVSCTDSAVEKAPRKEHTCRICNQGMVGKGHMQFRGQRYCTNAPGQTPKEGWPESRRAEAEAKKQAATDS